MCNASETGLSRGEEARARSGVYGLLARVFRAEADAALLRHLQSPEIVAALGRPGEELAAFLTRQGTDRTLADLAEEYTRLFLGPGPHLSLHEAVLVPGGAGLLWGRETAVVKTCMGEAGCAVADQAELLPDHLAVELEFMAHLCAEEAQGWLSGDAVGARNAAAWQTAFLNGHLGTWVGSVRERLEAARPSPFYAVFAELLCAFVRQEVETCLSR
ncbi:MAG: molecular chaperone TorD family protein [Magnetococcales bacterium]|nr:molecular chaperone TorD family protein [Magnetococcales bacterium]